MKTNLKDQNIFKDFCTINVDRKKIITRILDSEKIPYTIVVLDDAEHIIVFPINLVQPEVSNVLLAHYDRVNDTPGANDNSASVFFLLYHAKRINKLNHSTIIIFTDREEIRGAESVTKQGSFILGKYFRSKNIKNLNFYVFDMCGIGTTLLLGTAGEKLIKDHYGSKYEKSSIKKKIEDVKMKAENILLTVNNGEFFYLNPLFSDDLGLLLNEYPAVLISLLPYREAVEYKTDNSRLPKSWLCNHTMEDTIDTLDNKSWSIISPLLLKLSNIDIQKKIEENPLFSFDCYNQKLLQNNSVKKNIKPVLNYVTKELFSISDIKTTNNDLLLQFLLFSSIFEKDTIDYFTNIIINKSDDLSYSIFNLLNLKLENEFHLLPLFVRDKIKNKSLELGYKSIKPFLYENIINNLGDQLNIVSEPLRKKSRVQLVIVNVTNKEFKLTLTNNDVEFGFITLLKDNSGIIMDGGTFDPQMFIKLDPLNLLKGIRLVLIKWLKLNNNDSLRIKLSRSCWIGCYQLFNLISIELDGKSQDPTDSNLIYIWKR